MPTVSQVLVGRRRAHPLENQGRHQVPVSKVWTGVEPRREANCRHPERGRANRASGTGI